MVDYQGEKMSKSLGNLVLASKVLETHSADAFRLYLHSNHYRSRWEYDDDQIEHWSSVADDLAEAASTAEYGFDGVLDVNRHRDRFIAALEDDLNTPLAIQELQGISAAILEAPDTDDIRPAQATLRKLSGLLGLTLQTLD
jgi:cysteinyl-tRNA synthetase